MFSLLLSLALSLSRSLSLSLSFSLSLSPHTGLSVSFLPEAQSEERMRELTKIKSSPSLFFHYLSEAHAGSHLSLWIWFHFSVRGSCQVLSLHPVPEAHGRGSINLSLSLTPVPEAHLIYLSTLCQGLTQTFPQPHAVGLCWNSTGKNGCNSGL